MYIHNRLTQHVSGIIMPIVRRKDCTKPPVVLAWMCWLRLCGVGTRAERTVWMLVFDSCWVNLLWIYIYTCVICWSFLLLHYRVCNIPLTVPIPSQIKLVHTPHPTSWISILILSSHLRLDLPNGLFLSGFPAKTLCAPLLSPIVAYIYNAENIVQEYEAVPPFPDGRLWPPSHVGLFKYFELVLVVRQSHFWQFPMQSHKGDKC